MKRMGGSSAGHKRYGSRGTRTISKLGKLMDGKRLDTLLKKSARAKNTR